ncbi:Kelch repeat type 1 [Echinococcus multilocularis]|uniref:Kelch repeat type 1 n=1 Tax=Echinococcus multilocularis TaxID=6211 RepID=A0A0S4MI03_ECHMU|nr:Kelch repeat type 1 [Echinococcus multilocularis]
MGMEHSSPGIAYLNRCAVVADESLPLTSVERTTGQWTRLNDFQKLGWRDISPVAFNIRLRLLASSTSGGYCI